jgi:ABC-type bacteriocin/lantibiotic exporter with double-glycine peptidase domain
MVLGSFGVETTEDDLRLLCDSTDSGTEALKAVDAARRLGFPRSGKHNLLLDELKALVEDGDFPIVYVNLFPLSGEFVQHALVVIEVNEELVTVYDPSVGERQLPMDKFGVAWRLQRNLTILVLP